jgi:16S rRNA G966 N2-methylase RsmD
MADKATNLPLFTDKPKSSGPVECLGLTFENDDARRAYFLDKLREKLQSPEFRKIEGFPIGSDENILALSDPPYFTACPNPFFADFIKYCGKPYDPATDVYHCEPSAVDIVGSKSTAVYMAHTYATKVPPESIAPLIEHYTKPGDVIFDPFCGSGMTGVALHICNDRNKHQRTRKALVSDLSPFAGYLSHEMTHAVGTDVFRRIVTEILQTLRGDLSWLYKRKDGEEFNYALWSDVWICSNCGHEQSDWELTVDEDSLELKSPICRACNAKLRRGELKRKQYTFIDPLLGKPRTQSLQVLSRLALKRGNRTLLVRPDDYDLDVIDRANRELGKVRVPVDELPIGYNTQQPASSHNFTYTHDFYTPRNLLFIARYMELARHSPAFHDLLFVLTSVLVKTASRLHGIGFGGSINLAGQGVNTLQISSTLAERNMFILLEGKAKDLETVYSYPKLPSDVLISTSAAQSASFVPSCSVDYIFTDPPFGANINYSEVNFLYESWLGVQTNSKKEAIVNRFQSKSVQEYESLMTESMRECYRVLKPGRWITVEFHNSKNAIWNVIQNALGKAGFILADVRVFDKGQGTWKQMTSTGAVERDLIISAYKPNGGLEQRFELESGTEEGAWDFVRTHLGQLPVFVEKDGKAEPIAERMNYLLFDRMVAFHVQRGITVPISAPEFYIGLEERFISRDGMYFLPEQAAEYDKKRLVTQEIEQLTLFVTGEASAIQWLKQRLTQKPQTFQELHPIFTRELGGWQKHEALLDLYDLLGQNFLMYDGQGNVPTQIHAYLSSNFKDMRNLPKDHPTLRAKAEDRWYVPDPNKAADLEKLRERALLREFEEYRASTQRKLKIFRLEAVRAGFKKAWQEREYETIITVAEKIPETVLQEDPKLLMWYDQASLRAGHEDRDSL